MRRPGRAASRDAGGGKPRPYEVAGTAAQATCATIHDIPHLDLIDPDDASGLLKEEYDAALARAGKVFNIVRSMSLQPEVLRESMHLYRAIMFGPSPLSRQDRELLATVVSASNECHY